MESTANTINVGNEETTILFDVSSLPPNSILKFYSPQNWMSFGDTSVTIFENTSGDKRSGTLSLTATTTADTEYDGIASATSSYTINQGSDATTRLFKMFTDGFIASNDSDRNVTIECKYKITSSIGEKEITFGGTVDGWGGQIDDEIDQMFVEISDTDNYVDWVFTVSLGTNLNMYVSGPEMNEKPGNGTFTDSGKIYFEPGNSEVFYADGYHVNFHVKIVS